MDEPTVGVDPQSRNRIFEMIEALRARGRRLFTRRTTWKRRSGCATGSRLSITEKLLPKGTNEELVERTFGTTQPGAGAVRGTRRTRSKRGRRGTAGELTDETAEFTIEHVEEIAALLDDAAKAGLELEDVVAAAAESGVGLSAPDRKGVTRLILQCCTDGI